MMRSLYSGVAGLRTHQTRMDVVGNNIANVNTYAFKSQRATFRDMYYQTTRGASAGLNAMQLGYGAQVGSIDTIHVQAGYAPTDRPMDVYIDGEGFITVNDPSDDASELYTRIGALAFMPSTLGGDPGDFMLVDVNGNNVLGHNNGNLANPIADDVFDGIGTDDLDIGAAIIVKNFSDYTNISIGDNGIITGINAAGNVVQLASIAIAKISNQEGLTMQGNSYYKAINNTGAVEFKQAGTEGVGALVRGALEMSNVDLAKEFTDMITTQRGYQANSRIISVVDEMLNELVNLKR